MTDAPLFKLEFRAAQPSPPPTLVIRRNGYQVPIVLSEDEGLELYMLLKDHYEGGGSEPEADPA